MGQTVWSRNTKNHTGKLLIDVSELPAGLYFVRIGGSVKSLIIQ
jgi:hypothetical protein